MAPKMRAVEPGDFVAVPPYIEDTELLNLEFTLLDIKRLRSGEFVAGSLLALGVGSEGGGRTRARAMVPGGDKIPTWKIDNLKGSILFIPDHMVVVSDGPKPVPYVPRQLPDDFYIQDLLNDLIG